VKISRITLCLAISAFITTGAAARLMSPISINHDEPRADVICTGIIEGFKPVKLDETDKPDQEMNLKEEVSLKIVRVQKGDLQPGSTINIRYHDSNDVRICPEGYCSVDLGRYIMVFAKKVGDSYVLSRSVDISLMLSETAHTPYIQSKDAKSNIRWEILNSIYQKSPDEMIRTLTFHGDVLTASDIDKYIGPMLQSADTSTRAFALSQYVKFDNRKWLVEAMDCLKSSFESEQYKDGKLSLSDLRNSLQSVKLLPEEVGYAAGMLESPSIEVRQLASSMLCSSRQKEALPALKKALDDSDKIVRYLAMRGMAAIMRDDNGPIANFNEFLELSTKAEESKYLDYWKNKPLDNLVPQK